MSCLRLEAELGVFDTPIIEGNNFHKIIQYTKFIRVPCFKVCFDVAFRQTEKNYSKILISFENFLDSFLQEVSFFLYFW